MDPLNAIELARTFKERVLDREAWFARLRSARAYDMIVLTGSSARGQGDDASDLDLFLVAPLSSQREHELRLEYVYEFEGIGVELSMVTREKLSVDAVTRGHAHWWQGAAVIDCLDEAVLPLLRSAGTYADEELRFVLWTLYVQFEIDRHNLGRLESREDPISLALTTMECVRLFAEFHLVAAGEHRWLKWYGSTLERVDPPAFDLVGRAIEAPAGGRLSQIETMAGRLRRHLTDRLGFTDEQVRDWSGQPAIWTLFQQR